jgi:hypothetical protein
MRKILLLKLVLFGVLSAVDLVLTLLLLNNSEGMVYESNPIAHWFLGQCGWLGLAGFKAGAVLVVGVLSAVISLRRPRTGGTILSFGCAVLMIVVGYSSSLAGIVSFQPASLQIDQLRSLEETRIVLEKEMAGTKEYQELRKRLRDDLLGRQRTLDEAAAILANSELGKNPHWLRILQGHYPGFSPEECIASNLVEYTLEYGKNYPSRNIMTRQVKEEFLTVYAQRFPPHGKRNPVWDEEY